MPELPLREENSLATLLFASRDATLLGGDCGKLCLLSPAFSLCLSWFKASFRHCCTCHCQHGAKMGAGGQGLGCAGCQHLCHLATPQRCVMCFSSQEAHPSSCKQLAKNLLCYFRKRESFPVRLGEKRKKFCCQKFSEFGNIFSASGICKTTK